MPLLKQKQPSHFHEENKAWEGTSAEVESRNSERGKVVGTAKHGKGHSAPCYPSKTAKKEHAGRRLKTSSQ
jgi:hypothetical protein